MPMKKLTTLVVDDEPLARERLMGLLAAESDVEVLGECRDGEEAVSAIHERHPDLVLLDVEMPRMNGFQVIDTIGPDQMPMVIFVTAYDQHAIRAFQVRALDYLLKPFDRERFTDALQRARTHLESQTNGDLGRRLMALMKDMKRDAPKTDRLVVKSGGRLFFLRADEIDWIEAAGNYVRLHVGSQSHLLRETMNAIEGRLDPERFFRIHRSRIVNVERIQEMQPWLNGEYSIVLRSGIRLTLSRGYRERLQDRLEDLTASPGAAFSVTRLRFCNPRPAALRSSRGISPVSRGIGIALRGTPMSTFVRRVSVTLGPKWDALRDSALGSAAHRRPRFASGRDESAQNGRLFGQRGRARRPRDPDVDAAGRVRRADHRAAIGGRTVTLDRRAPPAWNPKVRTLLLCDAGGTSPTDLVRPFTADDLLEKLRALAPAPSAGRRQPSRVFGILNSASSSGMLNSAFSIVSSVAGVPLTVCLMLNGIFSPSTSR